MASIQKDKGRNRWRVRWREGGRGSKARVSKWYTDKRLAVAAQGVIESRVAAAKPVGPLVPLAELISRWVLFQKSRRRPRSERYVKESEDTLRALIEAQGWTSATDVAHPDIPIGTFRLLKALLRYGRDHHGLALSPGALARPDRPPRRRRRPVRLAIEDVLHLVGAAGEWSPGNGMIAELVALYGHRAQSLVGLTRAAFDVSYVGHTAVGEPPEHFHLTLRVKSGDDVRHRLLAVTARRLRPLLERAKPGAPVLLSHSGKAWKTGQAFSSWFHHSVGKGRGYYLLKRYAISFMFAGGIDVPTISSITGHTTATVLSYLTTNEELQAKALALLAEGEAAKAFGVYPV